MANFWGRSALTPDERPLSGSPSQETHMPSTRQTVSTLAIGCVTLAASLLPPRRPQGDPRPVQRRRRPP